MSLLFRPMILSGSQGEQEVDAFFDSGASYSCIEKKTAEKIARLDPLTTPIEFETADKGSVVSAHYRIAVDFYFLDTPRRFTDELFVIDGLAEELIVGATTMQKWQIRLDFDNEEVIYDKRMHRLRI